MKVLQLTFLLLLTILLGANLTAKAQGGEYFVDAHGKPFEQRSYTDVDGDPYAFDKWLPGKATTDKGHVFDNLKLKYNVYDDQLTFVYATADTPLLFAEPIKSFIIYNNDEELHFVNGFPPIDKQTTQTYYQVLSSGKVCLLKMYIKNMIETKGYNSSAVTKKFNNDVAYYTYKDGKIEPLKKNKDAVLTTVADKNNAIDTYLKTTSINFKKDTDLARLFNYYNAL